MTQILIPLHRARNLQPGERYVQNGVLYRIEFLCKTVNKRDFGFVKLATVTPLPAPKLTLPGKPI